MSIQPAVPDPIVLEVPQDYIGPLALPGTGRTVFWTGRVAVGLLYQPPKRQPLSADAERLQEALLADAAFNAGFCC